MWPSCILRTNPHAVLCILLTLVFGIAAMLQAQIIKLYPWPFP